MIRWLINWKPVQGYIRALTESNVAHCRPFAVIATEFSGTQRFRLEAEETHQRRRLLLLYFRQPC